MSARPVKTTTAVIVLLAVVVTGLATVRIASYLRDVPADPAGGCPATVAPETEVGTTLSLWASPETPELAVDTTVTVPATWPGADGLRSDPGGRRLRSAASCFFSDSAAYRRDPPALTVGDSDEAKAAKRELVGDHITLRTQVDSADRGYDGRPPSDLGDWRLSYGGPDPAWRDCADGLPRKMARSQILAVFCPPATMTGVGTWTVHLDLDGATIVGASHPVARYAGDGEATWKLTGKQVTRDFWVQLEPDRGVAAYLALQRRSGVLPQSFWPIGWLLLFGLIGLAARRGTRLRVVLLRQVALAGFAVSAFVGATNWWLAVSVDPSPSGPAARTEAVGVFVLAAWIAVLGVRRRFRWAVLAWVVLVAVIGALAYFGPHVITLETGPGRPGLHGWNLIGYLNHLPIGVLLMAAPIAGLAGIVVASLRRVVRGSETGDRWRLARYVVAFVAGLAVVYQWTRVTHLQWVHNRLFPGEIETSADNGWVIGQLPWLPDFIVHWLPTLIYYTALACVLAVLAEAARTATSWEDGFLRPGSMPMRLVGLLFAAFTVGTLGSYRTLPLPVPFLATLLIGSAILRRRPQIPAIRAAAGEVAEPDLAAVQRSLLRPSERPPADPAERWTDKELAIALGPRITWWGNGLYALKVGACVSVLPIAYDLYLMVRGGQIQADASSFSGVIDAVRDLASEVLTWAAAAFALGAAWPSIIGRRGVLKGGALGLVAALPYAFDWLLCRALGQEPAIGLLNWSLLIIAFLGVVGIVLDVTTLKNVEAKRWDFVDYLQLRDTRWLAAYGLTAAVAVGGVIHLIAAGEPLVNVPGSILGDVLGHGS